MTGALVVYVIRAQGSVVVSASLPGSGSISGLVDEDLTPDHLY